jgi:hypothetical protein
LLTIGHALIELSRMGHTETAHKGVGAYWQFVQRARNEVDRNGRKVGESPLETPTPLARDYWIGQGKRRTGEITSSHIIKYPYSFYALARELRDDELKRKIFEKIYYLTAVS